MERDGRDEAALAVNDFSHTISLPDVILSTVESGP